MVSRDHDKEAKVKFSKPLKRGHQGRKKQQLLLQVEDGGSLGGKIIHQVKEKKGFWDSQWES